MFRIKKAAGTGNSRLGTLLSNQQTLQTPAYSIGTQRGSIPHLTPDMARTLPGLKSLTTSIGEVYPLVNAVKHVAQVRSTEKPYHSLSCLRDDQSIIMGLRSPVVDLAYLGDRYIASAEQLDRETKFPYQLSNKQVAMQTDQGATRISPRGLIEAINVFRPDIVLLSGQESAAGDTKSRAEKVMRRNLEFIDECLTLLPQIVPSLASQVQDGMSKGESTGEATTGTEAEAPYHPLVICPVEGGSHLDKRSRNAAIVGTKGTELWNPAVEPEDKSNADAMKAFKDKLTNDGLTVPIAADGFILGGIGSATSSQQRLDMITASVNALPKAKPRFVMATGEPIEVVEGIVSGVDMFCSTYPLVLAEEGYAMSAPLTLNELKAIAASDEHQKKIQMINQMFDEEMGIALAEQSAAVQSDSHAMSDNIIETSNSVDITKSLYDHLYMDLRDDKYIEDARPLVAGCKCYTCCTHYRGYISHLLNTQEMLAEVLLMIHNTHQYDLLFQNARMLLAADETSDETLAEWLDYSQKVYFPHTHQMERNSRRKYQYRHMD